MVKKDRWSRQKDGPQPLPSPTEMLQTIGRSPRAPSPGLSPSSLAIRVTFGPSHQRVSSLDRFRSLPMTRSAFLTGRTLADLCRAVMALAFITCLGLLVGFRFHNGIWACLAGIGLIIGFG